MDVRVSIYRLNLLSVLPYIPARRALSATSEWKRKKQGLFKEEEVIIDEEAKLVPIGRNTDSEGFVIFKAGLIAAALLFLVIFQRISLQK